MTSFAALLEAFFTEWLMSQRRVSPATVAAYRDTFRLFLQFAATTRRRAPSSLDLADLDAALIASFLRHLETDRGNSVRTRNARLAALRSFYRFAQLRCPEHAALIARVLAIPQNEASASSSRSWKTRRPTRSWPHPTVQPGPAGVTAPSCSWPSRPACGSPNWPDYAAATCTWGQGRTSAAKAKAAKNAPRP